MSIIKTAALLCAGLSILAGCNNGSDTVAKSVGQPTPTIPVPSAPQPVTLPSAGLLGSGAWTTNDIVAVSGATDAFNSGRTAGRILQGTPASSTATYNGAFRVAAGDIVYGRMTLDADFATDTVTGSVGDFGLLKQGVSTGAPTIPMTGPAKINPGFITGDEVRMGMDAALVDPSGRQITMITQMKGTFYDNAGQSIVEGSISGDLSSTTGGLNSAKLDSTSRFLLSE